jgi:hypothetical protein
VSKGILSMRELRKWIELFVEYEDVLPHISNIEFCGQGLRYRQFAAQAAVVLKLLIGFSASVNKGIIGSGEEMGIGAVDCNVFGKDGRGKGCAQRCEGGRGICQGIWGCGWRRGPRV